MFRESKKEVVEEIPYCDLCGDDILNNTRYKVIEFSGVRNADGNDCYHTHLLCINKLIESNRKTSSVNSPL